MKVMISTDTEPLEAQQIEQPICKQLEAGVERGLPDGRFLRLRLTTPDDESQLRELGESLSVRTLSEVLFQSIHAPSAANLDRYLQTEFPVCVTIVAWFETEVTRNQRRLAPWVGLAHYWKIEPKKAMLTLVVGDPWRERGVGKKLFEVLVAVAREAGIEKLTTFFSADNAAMLRLLQRCGLTLSKPADDQTPWEINLSMTSPAEGETGGGCSLEDTTKPEIKGEITR